jgi:predicted secreted protein
MPTTNVVNSTLLKLYTGTPTPAVVGSLTDATLSVNHEPRDITTTDSAGWRELLEGLRSFSISGTCLLAYDDANGGMQQVTSTLDRTFIEFEIGTGVTGDPRMTGEGYVTSFELSSPGSEDNASVSFTIEGSGVLFKGTY